MVLLRGLGRRCNAVSMVLIALLFLAACSGAAEPGEGADGDGAAAGGEEGGAAAEPDIFVHAADDEPLSLDPAGVEPGEGGETMILQSYERLVEISPEGPELVPALATEVPTLENGLISDDGLTYTFPIRENVTFHDGTDLTADDVKYSWDRAIEMELPGGASGLLSDSIAETTVVDPQTFAVTLDAPSASFLRAVVPAMVASIVSQDAVEANGGITVGEPNDYMTTNMVGTGPYQLTAWNRGENLQFEIFDEYWGEPATLDLRIEIAPDPDVRVLGLRAGEFDMIETDPSFVGDIEGAEGVELYTEGLLLEPIHIGLNLNIAEDQLPPEDTVPADFFHDRRVRQAFNHAFDYAAFLQGALGGFGDFNPHYVPIGMFGYDPEAPVYDEQNLEEAERLFREAGWWDQGFTISVIAEEANLFEIAALVLKDSLEGLNPNFEVRVVALAEAQFDEAHAADPMPYAMWVKNADPFADPDAYMRSYIHPDGDWGQVHGFAQGYENPEQIATLIDDAALELDENRRAEMYAELQALLYDDPMWVIAAQEGIVNAHRDNIQGFVLNTQWPRPNVKFALFDK